MPNVFTAAALQMRADARRRSTWELGGSAYGGAAGGRLHYDWMMYELSPDAALRWSIRTLRDRARELVISNTTASAVPQLFSENVIGKDGILLQSTVKLAVGNAVPAIDGINEPEDADEDDATEFDDATCEAIENAWYRWCESQFCSADRQNSWPELEGLITEQEATDGEVLIRKLRGFDNAYGFALDLLDPDQLDHTYNILVASPGQNRISMGVEMDAWGAPVAYHLWNNHPSEGRRQRVRVPADEIIHLYIQRRPKQSRGVTWFAPAIVDLKMHGGYRQAEVVAARIAASKMGFFETDPEHYEEADDDDEALGADGTLPMSGSPGALERLPAGLKFSAWNPEHPNAVFPEFDKAILRSLATGFRVSYMSLSSDLNGTSFGSGRIGMLAERAVYQKLQQRFIARIETPVFREWLSMALLSGALQLSSFEAQRYWEAAWHPRRFDWIDPEKDISARRQEVRMGINSLTRICAEMGRDFEEVLQERAREIRMAQQYGVPIDLSEGRQSTAANTETAGNQPPAATQNDPASSPPAAARSRATITARRAREAPPVRLLRGG